MGEIVESSGGRRWLLTSETVVGRGAACDVRLDSSQVSRFHATLLWQDGVWWVRDLGSRNGTYVNGLRLQPGQPTRLGPRTGLQLGGKGGPTFRLTGEPSPLVMLPDRQLVAIEDGLAVLPNLDTPLLTVWDKGSSWVAEFGDARKPLQPGWTECVVAEATYRVYVPDDSDTTRRGVNLLTSMKAVFEVSSDEEFTRLQLEGAAIIELDPRTFTYTLLTLARARHTDVLEGVSEAEQGWVEQEVLMQQLQTSRHSLNVGFSRARKQIASAGVADAAEIVQRRERGGPVRFGISNIEIRKLSS